MLKIKTTRDGGDDGDGYRLLVSREWPKGLPASGADGFNPSLAPSESLQSSLRNGKIRFEEFGAKYSAELDAQEERLKKLRAQSKEFDITLIVEELPDGRRIGQMLADKIEGMREDGKKSAKAVIEEYSRRMEAETVQAQEKDRRHAKQLAEAVRQYKEGTGGKKSVKITREKTKDCKNKEDAKKGNTPAPAAGFRFLEHTADIMAEAWGPTFPAALTQTAMAMFSVLGKGRAEEEMKIDESFAAKDQLVVGLLSNILAECEARERLAVSIDIGEYDEKTNRIRCTVGLARTRPKDAIKAVTYHQLQVEREKGGRWRIQIVFDV